MSDDKITHAYAEGDRVRWTRGDGVVEDAVVEAVELKLKLLEGGIYIRTEPRRCEPDPSLFVAELTVGETGPKLCDGCGSTDKPVEATDDGRALACPDCLPGANAAIAEAAGEVPAADELTRFAAPSDWREQLADVADVAGQVHLLETWMVSGG